MRASSRSLKDATTEHGRINQTSRENQEIEFLHWTEKQKFNGTEYFMATNDSYLRKNSLEIDFIHQGVAVKALKKMLFDLEIS